MKRDEALEMLKAAMQPRIDHMVSNVGDGFAGSAEDRRKAKEQAAITLDINIDVHDFFSELFIRKFEE